MAKQTAPYSKINIDTLAQRVYEDVNDAVRVKQVDPIQIGGPIELEGTIQVTPPTDFRVATFVVTGSVQTIAFSSFDISSISIRALDTNNGNVRIGKAADISTNFYLLDPQGVFAQNVQATASPIAFVLDTGTTDARITVVAAGNPI